MLKGKEFGQAIAAAIALKLEAGLVSSKAEIARHFGIKPPSIADWEKKGAVSKDKLPELWRYFSDVVSHDHWGLTEDEWPAGLSPSSDLQTTPSDEQSPASPTQRVAPPTGDAVPHFARSFHVIPIFRLEAFMHKDLSDDFRIGETEIPGDIGPHAFAIRVEDDTMALASPSISKGMLVIFDPELAVKHLAIVLAAEPGNRPSIRQVLFDGADLYLTAPHSGLPPRKVPASAIRGVAVKAVIDLI